MSECNQQNIYIFSICIIYGAAQGRSRGDARILTLFKDLAMQQKKEKKKRNLMSRFHVKSKYSFKKLLMETREEVLTLVSGTQSDSRLQNITRKK